MALGSVQEQVALNFFLCITAVLIICALSCVLPPLWAKESQNVISKNMRLAYSSSAVCLVVVVSYCLYWNYGTAAQLSSYYSQDSVQKRKDFKKIRPLYSRLQRELVKNRLNLELDPANIELILHFAQANSSSQHGILDPSLKNLLNAVLKIMPQQVTALNLLAVDAYKAENYAQAIQYWELILQQFTPAMRGGPLEKVLKDKLKDTAMRLNVFESRRTK